MARRNSGKKAAKGGQVRTTRKASPKATASGKTAAGKGLSDHPRNQSLARETLFRPERFNYVRKQIEVTGCVFCEAVGRGSSPELRKAALVLYADATVMVIMNKYPYNPGHLLVLPRRHEGDMTKLTKAEVSAVFEMVQTCINILGEANRPGGFNVGLNLGASAGAGIPEHLHTHVIPRWSGDTNFFPLIGQTKVVVETLEQTFERLLPYFES